LRKMPLNSDDVYRRLQVHLDEKMHIGLPPAKSGVEIRILKFLFTSEEAQIATKLTASYESAEQILPRLKETGITTKELERTLNNMVSKGSINVREINKKKYYANAAFIMGMYEYQVKRVTPEFYRDFNQYLLEAFGFEYLSTNISQFRTIPMEKSITPQHYIPSYEEVRKLIEDTDGPIAVTECLCRKAQNMIGKPCKKTSRTETCIIGPDLAPVYSENGRGRIVTKKEALEILRQNEEDGLVLQASNAKEFEWFCSCCSCCCVAVQGYKMIPTPVEYVSSNYYAQSNTQLCSGCGTCKDRCQMGAIKIVDNHSTVNLKRCIGCGLCVPTCPEGAMHLIKKDKQVEPPKTIDDLRSKIMNKKTEIRQAKAIAK